MKHTRAVAALAIAFALGIGIAFVNLSHDPSTLASGVLTEISSPLVETELLQSISVSSQSVSAKAMRMASEAEATDVETNTQADSGVIEVSTVDELAQAVISREATEIVLTNDIIIPNNNTYANGILMYRPLELAPLNINLNGHNITAEAKYALHVFYGSFDITGQGTISAPLIAVIVKGSADVRYTDYTNLVIDKDVTISAPGAYSLLIDQTAVNGKLAPYAYGVKVDFNGTINAMQGPYVNGGIQHTENPVQITIGDTAKINAGEVAVYAAGYAKWQFGASQISGETGIGAKAGKFALNNTQITATGAAKTPEASSGGMDSTGAVFQLEHHKSYADQIELNINGGEYCSMNNDVFYEYGLAGHEDENLTQADIDIANGKFTAGAQRKIFGGDTAEMNIAISGGTYRGVDAPQFQALGYLAENLKVDANGSVVVSRPAHSSASSSNIIIPDDEKPSDEESNSPIIPDTGAILGRGIANAVSTATPIVGIAIIIMIVYGGRLMRRRHALSTAEVECEINAELHELAEPEEPTQDYFVARPMTKADQDEIRMNVFFHDSKTPETPEK